MVAQQQHRRAAILFGLADHAHSQVHYAIGGPMRAPADAALVTVQAALEPAVFAEAFVAGRQMSLEEAFATILAPGDVGVAPQFNLESSVRLQESPSCSVMLP